MKKGISPVISTILLILIAIAALGILYSFIYPLIRDRLQKAQECSESKEEFKIEESNYTCYSEISGKKVVGVTIKRGTNKLPLKGLSIIISGIDSQLFNIEDGETLTGVKMSDGSQTLELPKDGERRTYLIETDLGIVDHVSVAPITESDYRCDII